VFDDERVQPLIRILAEHRMQGPPAATNSQVAAMNTP
jgi:hypothetical protein